VKDGYIEVISIQFPGKKKMNVGELLNGMAFSETAKTY
jgi:methionyl-tRNA formyltransferase